MYAFLLALSVISAAIGIFAVGFGIPIHDFGLGNTLIISGSVAIVGGIVTFGLAVAVRQLRRIADSMGPRPVAAPRRQPVLDSAEGAPVPRRTPGTPYPPRPDMREPRPEPRPAPAAPPPIPAMEAPESPPVERPRPNIFGVARGAGEPAIVEESETVPLAPNRMPAAPVGRGGPPPKPERMPERTPERMSEPMPDPRSTPEARPASPADIMARLANLTTAPARPAPPRALPASERPPDPRPRQNMFDSLWPAEVRPNRPSQSETIARAPKSETRPEPKVDGREPRLDFRPEPRPDARPDLRFEPPPREPMMPPPLMPPPEQRPIAILKSGVIDGMAYTLYTDGSIEAELPQGTMRFGSIDELRANLENTEPRD